MSRVYIIVGPTCAGKTQFATNAFMRGHGENVERKDLLTYCENDGFILIGKWLMDKKVRGTDRLSRADIPLFFEQAQRLLGHGKDVVLEGDKACSRPLCRRFSDAGIETVVVWVRCSLSTSLRRSMEIGQTLSDSAIRRMVTKFENFYWDVKDLPHLRGVILDTDGLDAEMDAFGRGWELQEEERPEARPSGFAVFILTHGRAGLVTTDKCLRKHGYTGRIVYLIDDEDEQGPEYMRLYGDDVMVFDKLEVSKRVDAADNFGDRRAVLYARHAVFDAAEELGLDHFQMLDDDVVSIEWRYVEGEKLKTVNVRSYDRVAEALVRLLEDTGALSVALAQNGDFVGGSGSAVKKGTFSRKCMNSFVCRTGSRIDFRGTMNEDVAAYTSNGQRGVLMLTCNQIAIGMEATQSIAGGMSEFYRETGTYVKTAYSLITSPSCVRVGYLIDRAGDRGGRIHHNVIARNAYAKVVREEVKR